MNLSASEIHESCNTCKTTINNVFSVTYDLELRKAITIYYTFFFFLPMNVELVVWTYRRLTSLLG